MTGHDEGALSGLVIELAQGWAGPLVGAMMADFGAEVIKGRIDPTGRLVARAPGRRRALDAAVGALTAQRDRDELFRTLLAAGVPAGPVSTPPDLLGDRHLDARNFWVSAERAYVGTDLYPSRFLTVSRTPPFYTKPAPTLGQDNEFVLSNRLGLYDLFGLEAYAPRP